MVEVCLKSLKCLLNIMINNELKMFFYVEYGIV